jgi:hypothetical protein
MGHTVGVVNLVVKLVVRLIVRLVVKLVRLVKASNNIHT